MTKLLIALYSPAAGMGKSLVADHLVAAHGFRALKFAGPLKNMIRSLLEDAGVPHGLIEGYVEGALKQDEIPQLGVTCRHLMQTLGTEWGRQNVREDLWVYLTERAVERAHNMGYDVVIDDLRFPNELGMVRRMGGLAVRVERGSHIVSNGHVSEAQLDSEEMLTLLNVGNSKGHLYQLVDDLVFDLC